MTIDGLRLYRVELREDRLRVLHQIRVYYDIVKLADAHAELADIDGMANEAREFIDAAMRPEAEFSSMVLDYVGCLEL